MHLRAYIHTHTGTALVAYHDTSAILGHTIRHVECALALGNEDGDRCKTCTHYRQTLKVLSLRERQRTDTVSKRTDPRSHTNFRYLTSPEKIDRLHGLHHQHRLSQKKLARLQAKIEEVVQRQAISVDDTTTDDLRKVMEEEEEQMMKKFPEALSSTSFGDNRRKLRPGWIGEVCGGTRL